MSSSLVHYAFSFMKVAQASGSMMIVHSVFQYPTCLQNKFNRHHAHCLRYKPAQPRKGKGLHVLLRELSDDKDNMMNDTGLDVPLADDMFLSKCGKVGVRSSGGVRFQFLYFNNR